MIAPCRGAIKLESFVSFVSSLPIIVDKSSVGDIEYSVGISRCFIPILFLYSQATKIETLDLNLMHLHLQDAC